jgi:hypothetical protein
VSTKPELLSVAAPATAVLPDSGVHRYLPFVYELKRILFEQT